MLAGIRGAALARQNALRIIGLLTALMLAYQNCGDGEFPITQAFDSVTSASTSQDNNNPPPPDTNTNPPPPIAMADGTIANKVLNCFTNLSYNTCLFWKNPIAMNGAALPTVIGANTNLSSYQIHGVNIERTDYDNSGFLKNTSINVTAQTDNAVLQRVSTTNNNFKFNYGNDANHRFSQVMAFYWINAQIKYMTARVGKFFAKDKAIEVVSWYPDLDNAFWDPVNRYVVISSDSVTGGEFSLGAEIYLHEMGHANIGYGTNFAIYNQSNTDKTKICSQQFRNSTCCLSNLGCLGAIDEGQADYHAAILFPTNTALGEALVNKVNGFDECGITRKIDSNLNLTSTQAYNACGANLLGEVHLMGRVYASVWWEVRKKAALRSADEAKAIDKLFNEHLLVIAVADSFVDALTKIKTLDTQLFAGKYSLDFQNEFARRGITQ